MKKLLTVTLILSLLLSLSGCCCCPFFGEEEEPPAYVATQYDNSEIKEYLELYGDAIISSAQSSFADMSGMTCTISLKVEGMGIVATANINELDDLNAVTKALYKETFESGILSSTLSNIMDSLPEELEDLEYIKVNVCESDGDKIATITIRND